MAVVSTQDRVMTGLGMSVLPFALAGILLAFKKPAAAAVFGGIGIAAGVVGAVGAEMFFGPPGPSPLANKGWKDGYPASTQQLLVDVNKGIKEAGGYEYSDSALSGIGGFWRVR